MLLQIDRCAPVLRLLYAVAGLDQQFRLAFAGCRRRAEFGAEIDGDGGIGIFDPVGTGFDADVPAFEVTRVCGARQCDRRDGTQKSSS